MFNSFAFMLMLIIISLLIGMLGYRFLCALPWDDAFLNASMILTGMGPVDEPQSSTGKIFAGAYALYSGIVFLSAIAIFIYPLLSKIGKIKS